jgi:hypothetical protein
MKSIADQLPPEIASQVHPDRRKNEAAYWAVRDQLLDQYRGQWIGFADGMAIASGGSPVTVFHSAEASGRHPFFICVGREEEPCRIRLNFSEARKMKSNPILEELYAARAEIMAEYKGNLGAYLRDAAKRSNALDHPVAKIKQRTIRCTEAAKGVSAAGEQQRPVTQATGQ